MAVPLTTYEKTTLQKAMLDVLSPLKQEVARRDRVLETEEITENDLNTELKILTCTMDLDLEDILAKSAKWNPHVRVGSRVSRLSDASPNSVVSLVFYLRPEYRTSRWLFLFLRLLDYLADLTWSLGYYFLLFFFLFHLMLVFMK